MGEREVLSHISSHRAQTSRKKKAAPPRSPPLRHALLEHVWCSAPGVPGKCNQKCVVQEHARVHSPRLRSAAPFLFRWLCREPRRVSVRRHLVTISFRRVALCPRVRRARCCRLRRAWVRAWVPRRSSWPIATRLIPTAVSSPSAHTPQNQNRHHHHGMPALLFGESQAAGK